LRAPGKFLTEKEGACKYLPNFVSFSVSLSFNFTFATFVTQVLISMNAIQKLNKYSSRAHNININYQIYKKILKTTQTLDSTIFSS
jgi:hypothetical protein